MPTMRRLYYCSKTLGVAPEASPTAYKTVRGVQSGGLNTSFNLEQIFEWGQLAIYENVENLPDVELTVERVLDGWAPLYCSATENAPAATLVGRSNQKCNVAMAIFNDVNGIASGAANQLSQCIMSGMFVSQFGYNLQVNGPATESVTLVGNNKVWATGSFLYTGHTSGNGVSSLYPFAPEGVNFRQDMIMASCVWPTEIKGISSSGTNNAVSGSGMYEVAFQSVRPSVNLGREQLLELGRRGPFFRYVQFPVEVTCSIEVLAKDGDFISATEDGVLGSGNNLTAGTIKVYMQEGLQIDLGSQNKLSSVAFGGGDAGKGGGNTNITYSYINYNDFKVQHPKDPTVALRP